MPARPSHTSAVIIAVGIVIAAILAPVAATAAGQLVEISSVSGRKADVTRAEQLQVAEASSHQFVRAIGVAEPLQCNPVITAPSTKAIVVKTATVDVDVLVGNAPHYVGLRIGSSCNLADFALFDFAQPGSEHPDFGPGVVIPAGQTLWVRAVQLRTYVSVYGYKVLPTAVPATAEDAQIGDVSRP